MNLSNQVISGAFWLYGLRLLSRGVGIIRTVILARLLMPRDFGLVGIAMLIVNLLEVFTRSGLEHSIIQKTDVDKHELHSIWTFEALRGFALGGIMFLAAPYIAAFFESPDSLLIIRVMSVIPPLIFLRNIELIVAVKNLAFNKVVYVEASSELTGMLIGITLAVIYKNVWALVIASIASWVVQVIMTYVIFSTRPLIVWDWSVIRHHFRYGRQIWATGVSHYLYNNGDDWFVGKMLGTSALGLYGRAYQLGNLPTTELTLVLNRVLFPAFSKVKEDIARLRAAFLEVQKTISVLVAPIAAVLFFFARPFVEVVLGSKWLPMVPAFQVLVWWGGLRTFRGPSGSIFRAVGRPIITAYLTIAKLALMLALLWPARQYGIAGVAGVVLLTSLLEFPVMMWLTAKRLDATVGMIYRSIWLPFAVAFLAGLLTAAIGGGLDGWGLLLWGVTGTVGFYVLVLGFISYLFHLNQFAELRQVWQLVFTKVRER